ncbi:MAG: hypothetical protein R2874_09915 [Desulfobacterales bacterium]
MTKLITPAIASEPPPEDGCRTADDLNALDLGRIKRKYVIASGALLRQTHH